MGVMNMIGMKRSRESEFDSVTAMANCLMLLSGGVGGDQFQMLSSFTNHHHINPSRVFECKTCNRQFSSFQALGGHRASHKKPKLGGDLTLQQASPAKPKAHECSICGQEFAVGQALGGHMRRHRASTTATSAVSGGSNDDRDHLDQSPAVKSDMKRIWGLDLNLTPLENDDLEFGLGKRLSAPVNCVS